MDWIMGYQVGDYFHFRKLQPVLHHHFIHLRSFKWECKDLCIFVEFSVNMARSNSCHHRLEPLIIMLIHLRLRIDP